MSKSDKSEIKYDKYQKQIGGSLDEDLNDTLKNMDIDDISKIDIKPVKTLIIDTILNKRKIPDTEFSKINFDDVLGHGNFGETYKIHITEDIIKDNKIVVKKDTCAIAKVMYISDKLGHKYFTSEIVAHTLVNLSNCNLPILYGFFENVKHPNQDKSVGIIISELIKGKNLLKELTENLYDINKSEHLYFINSWIKKLEKTILCLHKNNVVHKDIKIDNVMIRHNDDNYDGITTDPVLIDYGLTCSYLSFCLLDMFLPYTSPVKLINIKNKNNNNKNLEIEKLNDKYAFGILILDVVSLLINKTLFHDTIRANEFTESITNINEFINNVLTTNQFLKDLTDKAYKYIKMGLSGNELVLLEKGIINKDPVLRLWPSVNVHNESDINDDDVIGYADTGVDDYIESLLYKKPESKYAVKEETVYDNLDISKYSINL